MIPVLRPGLSGREVVEDAKTEVLAVIRRRIMQLREVGAFDGLREPTLRELSEGDDPCFVHRLFMVLTTDTFLQLFQLCIRIW